MNQQEIETIVDAAVIKTLGELGIDLTTPDARREWIEDQLYMRAWRKSIQRGSKIGFGTLITVLVTGALGIFWLGISSTFGFHP